MFGVRTKILKTCTFLGLLSRKNAGLLPCFVKIQKLMRGFLS